MDKFETTLRLVKETSGAYMYKEVESKPPTLNNVYLKKYITGNPPPTAIKVVVESVD